MTSEPTREELEAGRGYETLFVPALFQPWTRHLVAGADIAPGQSVLDVACGTGVLARHAFTCHGECEGHRRKESFRYVGDNDAYGKNQASDRAFTYCNTDQEKQRSQHHGNSADNLYEVL